MSWDFCKPDFDQQSIYVCAPDFETKYFFAIGLFVREPWLYLNCIYFKIFGNYFLSFEVKFHCLHEIVFILTLIKLSLELVKVCCITLTFFKAFSMLFLYLRTSNVKCFLLLKIYKYGIQKSCLIICHNITHWSEIKQPLHDQL